MKFCKDCKYFIPAVYGSTTNLENGRCRVFPGEVNPVTGETKFQFAAVGRLRPECGPDGKHFEEYDTKEHREEAAA